MGYPTDPSIVKYEDGTTEEHGTPGKANAAAGEHYRETGEVPVVERSDDKDAGIASAFPGKHWAPLYHHGEDIVDVHMIERARGNGHEIGIIDLENGEELVAPTDERQFDPEAALPSADEVRERFRD